MKVGLFRLNKSITPDLITFVLQEQPTEGGDTSEFN